MSNQNPTTENKCDVKSNFDSDNASGENNEDSEIMKEIELSMKRDQAENEKFPKEIVIDGKKFTDIRVRDANNNSTGQEDDNLKQIEERMRQDQEENKKLPSKANIGGHEFTDIRVRDIQIEPRKQDIDNDIKQIEERMLQDQEENKHLPDKANIGGHEFTNIRVRDININPENQDNDAMKEIEECMRRDQEENKNLPEKVVIDGQEFTNIKVREIKLDEQDKPNRKPPRKWNYVYDRSVFYQPMHNDSSPRRFVRKINKPIKLTVTLKDIGMEKFDPGSNELPKLNNIKHHKSKNDHVHGDSKEKELPKLDRHKKVQEPSIDSANDKSPRKNKKDLEHVSTYDPKIFYTYNKNPVDSPVKPVRYYNDPIILTVTLKDIGMEGFECPLSQNNNESQKK